MEAASGHDLKYAVANVRMPHVFTVDQAMDFLSWFQVKEKGAWQDVLSCMNTPDQFLRKNRRLYYRCGVEPAGFKSYLQWVGVLEILIKYHYLVQLHVHTSADIAIEVLNQITHSDARKLVPSTFDKTQDLRSLLSVISKRWFYRYQEHIVCFELTKDCIAVGSLPVEIKISLW